jgi:transcriptional regulator NrdR family protein
MQISEVEVAKLAAAEKSGLVRKRKADVELKKITPDVLPPTVEPDPAEVARFAQVVKDLPDVREDAVMELKEEIEKGEYEVSGEEVADMMARRMKADHLGRR